MSQVAISSFGFDLGQSPSTLRRRLYGLAGIVALSFLLVARRTSDSDEFPPMYLPLGGASMLMLCLAGAEFTLHTQRLAGEQRANLSRREQEESEAAERQRSFNHMWQELADSRGESAAPAPVLKELTELFSSDLVAVWSADKMARFHLRGAHPLAQDSLVRLEKVAQMSPCFDALREAQRQTKVTDIERQTSKGLAWFCEESELRYIMLCPVLVRHELVGVLAFFYRQNPQLSSKQAEEMQSAANLFLCAF